MSAAAANETRDPAEDTGDGRAMSDSRQTLLIER